MAKKPKYLEQSEEEKADTQGIRDADDDIAQERADWVEIASEAAAGRLPPEAGEDARRALAELPKVPVGRLGGQGMRGPASAPAADDPLLMGLAKDPREVAARKPLTEAFSPLTPDDITETFPAGGGTKDQQAQLAVQGLVMNPSKLGNRGARWQAIKAVDRGATGGLGYRVARAMPKAISDAEGLDAEAAALEATGEGLGTGVTDLVEMGAMMTPRGLASRGARAFQQGVLKLPGVGAWVARNPKLGGALVGAGAAAAGNATQKGLQAGVDASLAPGLGVPEQIIQGVKAGGQGAAEGFAGLERTDKGGLTYSPMTHLMGAGGGALAGQGAAMQARNPNYRFLAERGVEVGPRTPGRGGALDDPMVRRGMEPGPLGGDTVTEAGKGRVAGEAAARTRDMLQGRTQAIGREKGAAVEAMRGQDPAAAAMEDALRRGDVDAFEAAMQGRGAQGANPNMTRIERPAGAAGDAFEARREWSPPPEGGTFGSQYTGRLADPQDVSQLFLRFQEISGNPARYTPAVRGTARRLLSEVMMPALRNSPPGTPIQMPAGMVDDLRAQLWELADPRAPGTGGRSAQHFNELAGDAASSVGDELAEINARANAGYREVEGARRALGIPGKATAPISDAQTKNLATQLGRRGADTRTAGRDVGVQQRGEIQEAALQEAFQRFPGLQQLVEAPELLQRRSNLEFTLSGPVGGLLNKVRASGNVFNFLVQNWDPAKVRLIAPLLMGTGTATRALAPGSDEFMLMLGDGERQRQKEMR